MTISSTTTKNSYSGNGSTTTFAYGFYIPVSTDIQVYVRSAAGIETLKSQGTGSTNYGITGVTSASGGNIVFVTAPTNTETVTLRRATALTQGTDYVANDPFPAETHEDALDKLTIISQDLQEQVDRSLKISKTNTMTSTDFTNSAANRASKVLAFDSSGEISVTQEIGNALGNWAASTIYVLRDIVKDTNNNNIYICITAHTSSGSVPISSNTDAAKWRLLVDAASSSTSQTAAASSATAAASSSTSAASSASAASSYRDTATTKASEAASSATASASSATSAAASYDSFDDRYLGAKGSAPSTDNDGSALLTGALYFNSSSAQLFNWTAADAWEAIKPTSSEQTNINALSASAVITDMGLLATSAVIEDMGFLGTSANVTAMGLLGNSDVIADMALLGTSAIIADLALLGNSDVIADMAQLASSDFISDLNTLASSSIVTDMDLLATSANVTAMGLLGTSSNVTAQGLLGTSANVTAQGLLGNSSNITAQGLIGTSANITAQGLLGTSANVTNMAALNGSGVITNMANLNASGVVANIATTAGAITNVNNVGGSIANVNTVASNLSGVNSFAARYRVDSSDPSSSLDEGDLAYNSTSNTLKYYNGSSWITIVAGSLTDVVQDGSPQLGGALDVNGNAIVSTSNASISITPNGSGDVIIDGLKYPQSDGSSGQFLKTNGSTQLSWATVDLSSYATLASPTLTGNPVAPTQSASNNSTRIATTAYADTAIANLVDSSPSALNTLNELADALGDDANFSTTVTNSIATKAVLSGSENNNIATVTGANALVGEARLKYDGDVLWQEASGSTTEFRQTVDGGGTYWSSLIASASDVKLYTRTASPLIFGINNTEKMRIATSGQIGIGGANYGSDGHVLTSTGASSAPAWEAISASNLTSGTLPMARLSGTLPALNGSALTTLNASNLSSGTLGLDRIQIASQTELSAAPATGDEIIIYDASASANRRINFANFSSGISSAPTTAQVATATAAIGYADVGSYLSGVRLHATNEDAAVNSNKAGSTIYAGGFRWWRPNDGAWVGQTTQEGSALSGTWKSMGKNEATEHNSGWYQTLSLWKRVS